MAHYRVSVRTARTPEEALTFMAGLESFAEWDPPRRTFNKIGDNAAACLTKALDDVRVEH